MERRIQIWVWVSAGFMLVGGFGPWATVFGVSVDGTNGDGWIVIGAGLFGGALCYFVRSNRWAGIWAIVGGVVGLGTTGYDRGHIQDAINKGGAFAQALMHVGWGLNLGLLASLSMLIAGAVGALRKPATASADTPEAPAVPAE